MNINVSGVNNNTGLDLGYKTSQNVAGQGTVDTSEATSASRDSGLVLLMNMNKGDVFTGKILDITQDQVTLLLNGSAQVKATLSDAFSYNIGDYASFSIKDNTSGTIILKSLNSENLKNLMNDRTIGNVITSAGLAVSDTTVSLVNNLMKQGMPIDSNTLNQYARMLDTVSNATPEDVVFMTKMGIPVTGENVMALHDYYDFEEGITARASDMAGEFTDALASVIEESDTGAEKQVIDKQLPEALQFNAGEKLTSDESFKTAGLLRDITDVFTPVNSAPEKMADSIEKPVLEKLAESIRALIPGESSEELTADSQEAAMKNEPLESSAAGLASKVADGLMSSKEFFGELSHFIEDNNIDRQALLKLFKSTEFKKAADNMMRQEMFIRPENVSGESLKRLYAKIINDSSRIAQRFGNNSAMAGFVDASKNAAADVNFLNDAGRFMSFVQIPLKMTGQNAKGDLYVYTNKRGKSADNDDLKAFLHLDMNNLGPLDVLVNLKGNRVTTNFKVASDEILDYIESHIEELNKALNRMGYNVSTQVQISDKDYSFKKSVLEQEMPPASIKRYNFDVRA